MPRMAWFRIALLLAVALAAPAAAREEFPGPVRASVVSVHDGDTFLADAHVWPGQFIRVNVRIRGIDAPEIKSRCAAEREAARRAREALAELLGDGEVEIANIGGAKYYGRVLADVSADSEAVAERLLALGLVRPYRGGRRERYCG